MASKHKITTYFSNTTTYDWVTKAAAEQGVTKSGYLEGLIRQEMERNREKAIIKSGLMIYEVYRPKPQSFLLSEQFGLAISPLTLETKRNEYYNGMIHESINAAIYDDFYGEVTKKYIPLPKNEYYIILLKTEFEGRISLIDKNALNIAYHLVYQPFIITQDLWDKHDGRYDFFNIRYLRQTDLINKQWERTIPNRYVGVAPIFDRKQLGNDKGCFFIPVLREPQAWQEIINDKKIQKNLSQNKDAILGVTVSSNKERFNLKGRELFKELYKLS
ncbi:hypothetical protein AO825_00170 [Pectobacterium brasiliense]|uniref:hypothetical protein n=1 Tax=Pectobacterium brasiliense TaxID=180957 RepID=UPI0001A43838|nr:hypothetical protein [Pectobacterium brasiliense]KGA23611.1 hypothetical protein KS44_10725 [Pectobacterium brasiliense]KRF66032.1 hypothetical protein AO825_00170 [Pectobacterium brasiliense]MBN3185524.1 hypothetical protein [Pectobacterium brasiliense]QHG30287.1 hypothetical protein GT391_20590 [Pectobacterium brasiliense]